MTSAFAYAPPLSLLLREAKGRQHPAAVRAFEDILFARCSARLKALRLTHGVKAEDCLMAPLRLRRAARGEWHPADLLLRACGGKGDIEWKWRWQTQSSTPAHERRMRVLSSAGEPPHASEPDAEQGSPRGEEVRGLADRRAILVIDDVLTSGETALKVLRAVRARPALAHARFHLFTLLRAPAERGY